MRWWMRLALALAVALLVAGCHKKKTEAASPDPGASMVVRDSTQGLLLTWIDDKGDFHVEQKVGDVPMMGRDAVRVVDPNKDDGTHADKVYVADLRQVKPDGTYPVTTMTRDDFEKLAVARREKHGPTLASAAPPPADAGPPRSQPGSATGGLPHDTAQNRPAVIIYGASWCGACHEAARYLSSKGIPFVEKDIEKDGTANREMQAKLRANGLRGGSIPVIDVRGKVMVGFNPASIDAALGHAT